jgi:hypothetical protein
MLGEPFVGRVALKREDGVGQFVVQPASRHGHAMIADLARCMAVTQPVARWSIS